MSLVSPLALAEVVHRRLEKTERGSPGLPIVNRILETIYLATLKTEEGRPLQLRVVWENPRNPDPKPPMRIRVGRWTPVFLSDNIPFNVSNIAKLCKAADPWSSFIGIYGRSAKDISIWGFFDQTVHFNTALVRESGGGMTLQDCSRS